MSIRARLNELDIFSFDYDDKSWRSLKGNHKELNLIMPCCDIRAIPKTSKLNNYFFAHDQERECNSAPETAEHIHLKTTIARIALSEGWYVTTEKQGMAPSGEAWIADVFCMKGNGKLAFEVQWSPQTNDEFIRRTQKYKESGVRVAWLYRLRGKKWYYTSDFPYGNDVPVFGIRHNKETTVFSIPQFNVSVEEFIKGALNGQLKWSPRKGERLIADFLSKAEYCWNCKKKTTIVTDVQVFNKDGVILASDSFSSSNVPEFVLRHLDNKVFEKYGIGKIKSRYSKTLGYFYLSNGCIHCDALMGNHFLKIGREQYRPSIGKVEFFYDQETLNLNGDWFLSGVQSEPYF